MHLTALRKPEHGVQSGVCCSGFLIVFELRNYPGVLGTSENQQIGTDLIKEQIIYAV